MMQSIKWNGDTITQAGLYSGVSMAAYHGGTLCGGRELSASRNGLMWSKGPKHFHDKWVGNPNRAPVEDSADFDLGKAAHHVYLRQPDFAKEFAIEPDELASNRRTKEYKVWKAAQRAQGKTVLTIDMATAVKGMAIEIGKNVLVRECGLLSGLVERTIVWRDQETGVWCLARPDVIPTASGDYVDLKTTLSVAYRDIQRSIADFNYPMQGAFVMEGARAIGLPADTFSLLFVEKNRPHAVRLVSLKDEDLARGEKMNRVALRMFADCLDRNRWPGPGDDRDDAEYINMPDWWRKSIDDRIKYELREAA
ncbi:MAG TPA: PD-(D/E)XK nuclease-like domain-containing protein [Bradyrhizobium sp.]|jgi:hypothetical protein